MQAHDNCPVCINIKQDMGKDNSHTSAGKTYGKIHKHIINVWTVVIKKYHRLCILNNKHWFLTDLEIRKSKIEALANSVFNNGLRFSSSVCFQFYKQKGREL